MYDILWHGACLDPPTGEDKSRDAGEQGAGGKDQAACEDLPAAETKSREASLGHPSGNVQVGQPVLICGLIFVNCTK